MAADWEHPQAEPQPAPFTTTGLPPGATYRLTLLALATALGFMAVTPAREQALPDRRLTAVEWRLDPNTAPWWQLAHLPGAGQSLGRQIAASAARAADPSDPVFETAADLSKARGVGARKARQLAPFLRFASASGRDRPD